MSWFTRRTRPLDDGDADRYRELLRAREDNDRILRQERDRDEQEYRDARRRDTDTRYLWVQRHRDDADHHRDRRRERDEAVGRDVERYYW